MAGTAAETLIGAVVLLAAGGFLAYAAQRSDMGSGASSYELAAKFRRADGLAVGSDVRVSGVKVGSVTSLTLDTATWSAVAKLSVPADFKIPDDSDARIETEGLLGGNYVSISPGASDFMLKPGDEITMTQGSVSFLDLLMKFGTDAAK